eukprot:PITA_06205
MKALDSEAKKYGLRLILSLANNYVNFGGKAQYVQWAHNARQNLNSENNFFTNPTIKGYYKNHVKGWIDKMVSHVKSIDGNHLLEVGLEGFYGKSKKDINLGFSVGTNFISNNQIPTLDFATIHSYPNIWLAGSNEETQISFVKIWIENHLEHGSKILKKPVLFVEFWKSCKDPGFDIEQRDNLFDMVYKQIYASVSRGREGGGAMFWQLMAEGMSSYGDGYEIVLSQSPSTTSIISAQSHKLAELAHLFARLYEYEKSRHFNAHRKARWHKRSIRGRD